MGKSISLIDIAHEDCKTSTMNKHIAILTIIIQLVLPLAKLPMGCAMAGCCSAKSEESAKPVKSCCEKKQIVQEEVLAAACCCNPQADSCTCSAPNDNGSTSDEVLLPNLLEVCESYQAQSRRAQFSHAKFRLLIAASKFSPILCFKSCSHALFEQAPTQAIRYTYSVWLL